VAARGRSESVPAARTKGGQGKNTRLLRGKKREGDFLDRRGKTRCSFYGGGEREMGGSPSSRPRPKRRKSWPLKKGKHCTIRMRSKKKEKTRETSKGGREKRGLCRQGGKKKKKCPVLTSAGEITVSTGKGEGRPDGLRRKTKKTSVKRKGRGEKKNRAQLLAKETRSFGHRTKKEKIKGG